MNKCKIGILGLTLELYKKNIPTLMPKLLEFSKELNNIISKFSNTIHYPIAWNRKKLLDGLELFEKEKVDGIIIVFLSYSPSLEILPLFKKTKLPILIWNTQKLEKIDNSFSTQDLLENHGMHGVQDLTSVLKRENMKFTLITGHYKDEKTLFLIRAWCNGVYASSKISSAKIGRIGGLFPKMGDFAISKKVLKDFLGPEVIEIENKELRKFKKYFSTKKSIAEEYFPSDAIWSQEITEDIKKETFNLIRFLENIVKEKDLSGLAINFKGLSKEIPMPFIPICCLLASGIGYGGEGDIYSASNVLLGHILSENKATFSEMFTTDYVNSRIFMSHMGELNISLRRKDKPVKIVLNKMELGNKVPTTVAVFSIIPGKYTLMNLTGINKGLKMIFSLIDVEDEIPFEEINTPHFLIKPLRKVEDFLTAYSLEGGTHHLAIVYGDIRTKLKFFCDIKNIPWVEI